jgi:hypothetical protein
LGLIAMPFALILGYYLNCKSYCKIMKWWTRRQRRPSAVFNIGDDD